jgi:hypothetical protein
MSAVIPANSYDDFFLIFERVAQSMGSDRAWINLYKGKIMWFSTQFFGIYKINVTFSRRWS